MNVRAGLEFELAYFETAVQHFSHYSFPLTFSMIKFELPRDFNLFIYALFKNVFFSKCIKEN